MKDNKKNIIIIILSLLLLTALGYIIYNSLNNNTNKNTQETNNQNTANTLEQNNTQNNKYQEYNVVGEAYNGINIIKNTNDDIDTKNGDPVEMVEKVILPKILKDTDTTKTIIQNILDDNKWAISAVEKGLQNEDNPHVLFDVTTNYDYTINNDILYILVTTQIKYYRSHGWNDYYSYYYDIKNDKELTTNEVATRLNIKLKDLTNAKEITNIMYLNNYKQAKVYYKELEDNCSSEECKNETIIEIK